MHNFIKTDTVYIAKYQREPARKIAENIIIVKTGKNLIYSETHVIYSNFFQCCDAEFCHQ